MGVVLWYRITLPTGTRVSNDVSSGDFILDAEIQVKYGVGYIGTFEATLTGLPDTITTTLTALVQNAPGGLVGPDITIELGYFDRPRDTVFQGRIQTVKSEFRGNRPAITLKGSEAAGFALANTDQIPQNPPRTLKIGQETTLRSMVTSIATAAQVDHVEYSLTPDPRYSQGSHREAPDLWTMLRDLADENDAELLAQDGHIYFGPAISVREAAAPGSLPALLSADDRLVVVSTMGAAPLAKFEPQTFPMVKPGVAAAGTPVRDAVGAFDFTTAGLPELRAGVLVVASVASYDQPLDPFRISDVTHRYGSSGYTCEGRAIKYLPMQSNRLQTQSGRKASAQTVADIVGGKIKDSQYSNPSIDVGRVKDSKPADGVASVCYRQDFSPSKASPSVDLDVPLTNPSLTDKPLASPFAFDGVGLVVPVYDGMRAVLAQNRGSRQDAILAGFLWSNDPKMPRPPAKHGDWWLCLPTQLDGQGKPTNKTANDITAADGLRAIEATGLGLRVGKSKLTDLGQRPALGNPDELVIEHSSGTTLKIDSSGNFQATVGSSASFQLSVGSLTLKVSSTGVDIS